MKTEYTRNNQPHFQHIGGTFSVTLLAHDAVPQSQLDQLRSNIKTALFHLGQEQIDEKLKKEKRNLLHRQYDEQLEELLNAKRAQEHPFSESTTANCLLDKIRAFDGRYYRLEAACIMSNHVHMLLDFSLQVPDGWDGFKEIPHYQNLAKTIGQIKGGTSFMVNKLGNRKGPLWRRGYHDRYIRSARHYQNVLNYIIQNPVKAGVAKHWKDFPHTYLHPRFNDEY